MTDTVNVPTKPTYEMQMAGCLEMNSNVLHTAASIYRAMLAAAPKAEPHLGFLVETDGGTEWVADDPRMSGVPEYYDNLRPFTLEEAKSQLLSAWEVAQPEAPKVEQESMVCRACGCSYRPPRPAPSSDELLEALERLTSSIKCVEINGPKDRAWGMGSNLPKHYDAAIALIAKHKGPQS